MDSEFKVYSRRKNEAERPEEEPFQYDEIPPRARNRLLYAVVDALWSTDARRGIVRELWNQLGKRGREEALLMPDAELEGFALGESVEHVLDMLEVGAYCLAQEAEDEYENRNRDSGYDYSYDYYWVEARGFCDKVNSILREYAIGYEMVDWKFVRVDSKFIHREVVKPALGLLHEEGFEGAVVEFGTAHEHYRRRRYGEAITQANSAFESTMKCVLERMGHPFNKDKDTASKLIDHCIDAKVIPQSFESSLNAVSQVLKSSLPSMRSKMGAHGAGLEPKDVDKSYAELALHLAATYIVFLVDRYREMSREK